MVVLNSIAMMNVVDSGFNSQVLIALEELQSKIMHTVEEYDDSVTSVVVGFISQMGMLGVKSGSPGLFKWIDLFKVVQEHQGLSKTNGPDKGSRSARVDCAMDMCSGIVSENGFVDTKKLCYMISQYAAVPWTTDRDRDIYTVLLAVEKLAMDSVAITTDLFESFKVFTEELNVLEEKVISGFREIGTLQSLSKPSKSKFPRFKLQDRVSCILKLTQVRSQLLVLGSRLVVCSICEYYLLNSSARSWAGYDFAANGGFVACADKSRVVDCANMVVNCANKLLSNMTAMQIRDEHGAGGGKNRFASFLPEELLKGVLLHAGDRASKSACEALEGVIDVASSPLIDLIKILKCEYDEGILGYADEVQAYDAADVIELDCLCQLNIAVDELNTFRNSIKCFGAEVEIDDAGSRIRYKQELCAGDLRLLRSFISIEERIVRTIRDLSVSVRSVYRGPTVFLDPRCLRIFLLHVGDCGSLLSKLLKAREFQALHDRARFELSGDPGAFKRVKLIPGDGNRAELSCWGVMHFSFTALKEVVDYVMSTPHVFCSSEVFAKALLKYSNVVPKREVQLRSFLQNQKAQVQDLVSKGELVSVANFCAYCTEGDMVLPEGLIVRAVEKAAPGVGNNDVTQGASHALEIVYSDESAGNQEAANPSKNIYPCPFVDQYKMFVFTQRLNMLQSMFSGVLSSNALMEFLRMSSPSAELQDFMFGGVSDRVGGLAGACVAPSWFRVQCIGSARHSEENDYDSCIFSTNSSDTDAPNPVNKLGLFAIFNSQFSLLRKFLYRTRPLSNWRALLENVHEMYEEFASHDGDLCAVMSSRGIDLDFSTLRQFVEHADALIFVSSELLNHKANLEEAYDPLRQKLLKCVNDMIVITNLLIRHEVFLGSCELKKISGSDIACSYTTLSSRLSAVCDSVNLLLSMNVDFVDKYLDERAIGVVNLVMSQVNSKSLRVIRSLINFENKINDFRSSITSEFDRVMRYMWYDNEFAREHERLCNSHAVCGSVDCADFSYLIELSESHDLNSHFYVDDGFCSVPFGDDNVNPARTSSHHMVRIILGISKVMDPVFSFLLRIRSVTKECEQFRDDIVREYDSLGCDEQQVKLGTILKEDCNEILTHFLGFLQEKRGIVVKSLDSKDSINKRFLSQFFSYTNLHKQLVAGPFAGKIATKVLDIPSNRNVVMQFLRGGHEIPKVPSGLVRTTYVPGSGTEANSEFLYPNIFIPQHICDQVLGYADVNATDCFMLGTAKPLYAFASSMVPSGSSKIFATAIDNLASRRFTNLINIVVDVHDFLYPDGRNLDMHNLERCRNFLVVASNNDRGASYVSAREEFFSAVGHSERGRGRLSVKLGILQEKLGQLDKFLGVGDYGFLEFLNSLLREVNWSVLDDKVKYSKPLENFAETEPLNELDYRNRDQGCRMSSTTLQNEFLKIWDGVICNIFTVLKNAPNEEEYRCICQGLDAVDFTTDFDMAATRRACSDTRPRNLGNQASADECDFVRKAIRHCPKLSSCPVYLPFPTISRAQSGKDNPLLVWTECFQDVFRVLNEEFCEVAYRVMFSSRKAEACHNIICIASQQLALSEGVARDFEHSGVFQEIFGPYCVVRANAEILQVHGQFNNAYGKVMQALNNLLNITISAYQILYHMKKIGHLHVPINVASLRKPLYSGLITSPVLVDQEAFCEFAPRLMDNYYSTVLVTIGIEFFCKRFANGAEGDGAAVISEVIRGAVSELYAAIKNINEDFSALKRTDAEAKAKFYYFKLGSETQGYADFSKLQMRCGSIKDVINAINLAYGHFTKLFNVEEMLRVFDENYGHKMHCHEYWAAGIDVMFGVLAKHTGPFRELSQSVQCIIAEGVKNYQGMNIKMLANMLAICHKAHEAAGADTAESQELQKIYDDICEFGRGNDIDDVSSSGCSLDGPVRLEEVHVSPGARERVSANTAPLTSVEGAECTRISKATFGAAR